MNFYFIFIGITNCTKMYVLLTRENTYIVEYLIGMLILSNSLFEAMVFEDLDTAIKFKQMLLVTCQLQTSISTFIS